MSSVKRRARTPLGGPPLFGSSAFTTLSSTPFDIPSRSRAGLHQSSLDLNRARNPPLSRRFRDSSWGSSECLFRPSSSALASTANYVLSSLGGSDFHHRCRSPARGMTPPPRRMGRESSPSPMSSYYKSTYASSWYDEYKPVIRERPALKEYHRPARGSKERRESMGIITRHRQVVKFREDPTLHESSPVVSRTRQDESGHSTRSVDSGIGSFKEGQSGQSPVDFEDMLGFDSPPAAAEEIRRELLPVTGKESLKSSQNDVANDNLGRRRRMRNRDDSEERLNSATSSVPQESERLARSAQRRRDSAPKPNGTVPECPAEKHSKEGEITPTIELPKVSEIYETVVVKLKKGAKGKGSPGDVSPTPDRVESVVHCLPTPNGHCDDTTDESLQGRTREISPAVITLELTPKKSDNDAKQPTQDTKAPTATAATALPGAKKATKASKISASLAQLKTGRKAEQEQAKVKKDAKAGSASPQPKSSQPPTPEPRGKPKPFSKAPESATKVHAQNHAKPKTQDMKSLSAANATDAQARVPVEAQTEIKEKQQTNITSLSNQRDKKPAFQQQEPPIKVASEEKPRAVEPPKTTAKDAATTAVPQTKAVPAKPDSVVDKAKKDAETSKKPALGMLEFRKKEPLGRLEFKSKEPQGRLELKKRQPIPLCAPPEPVAATKPRETTPLPKSPQEAASTPPVPPRKDAAAAVAAPASVEAEKVPRTGSKPAVPTSLPQTKRPPALPEKPSPLSDKPHLPTPPPRAGSEEGKADKLLKKIRRSKESESNRSAPVSPLCSTAPTPLSSPKTETSPAAVVGTPPLSPATPDASSGEPPLKAPRKVKKVKKASKIKVASSSSSTSSGGSVGSKRSAKKASKELESASAKAEAAATSTADSPDGVPVADAVAVVEPKGSVSEPPNVAAVELTPENAEQTPRDDEADASCECKVNCHKKCEKHMANLCGVNQKLLSEVLATVKKDMATSPPSGTATPGGKPRTGSGAGEDASTGSPAPSTVGQLPLGPASPRRSSTISDLAELRQREEAAQAQERDRREENKGAGEDATSRPPLPGTQSAPQTPTQQERVRFRKYNLTDFHLLKVLGKGSFGKVLLAELKGTKRHYAVKCLKKDVVLEDDDVECTLIERRVLAMGTQHPFLCNLFCTFQSQSHLFFVMEFLNGGDLMFHIQQSGRFDQDRARFYAAEIVCALKFLHKKGIVYRDLKLDNLCIDSDGHVRIIDFGMCKLKVYRQQPRAFCGTPEYMAPEIIKGQHYNQSVDWWSFGILTYEMLIGQSPFNGTDEDELFWSVCNEEAYYPRFLSREAKSLLVLLLDKNAETRLGMPGCPAGDVCDQPFFRTIQWDKLERKEIEPPFKPKLKSTADVSNFDSDFTMEKPVLTPIDPQILASMDQEQFKGFTYTNPAMTD
ncbi:uncharacterized protein LOC144107008 isoform X2 [Amblyomma americanum]